MIPLFCNTERPVVYTYKEHYLKDTAKEAANMSYTLQAACFSHIGKRRANHEDNFYFNGICLEEQNRGTHDPLMLEEAIRQDRFFAVFDGMGGENYGEQAAFAAAVKIDTFAYLPVQDFGNAFSTFIAQNYGAGQHDRLRRGFRQAVLVSAAFSAAISLLVCVFAAPLMRIFVQAGETEVLASGVRYLRIEGACYVGIGCLFLLYGFYRAVKRPGMSVVLTVISLGVRVLLAYLLAGPVGEVGIWLAIPIGWALADLTGFAYYARHRAALLPPAPTAAVINLK